MATKKSYPLSKVYQLIEPGRVVMISTQDKDKANVMTMTWLTMIDFMPPQIGCVVGQQSLTHKIIKKTKECVINLPTADMLETVVGVGNSTGSKIDKFAHFKLTQGTSSNVKAPRVDECYANLECKVIDATKAKTYNFFIFEVVKAWVSTTKKKPAFLHHRGEGTFFLEGKEIKTKSKMK